MKDDGCGAGVLINGVGSDPGVNPHGSTIVFAANGGASVAKPGINGNYLFDVTAPRG